jgi:hypothetical protein
VRRRKVDIRPAGKIPNDVEIKLGNVWTTATSVRVTEEDSLFWKTEHMTGNCPSKMWKWKKITRSKTA